MGIEVLWRKQPEQVAKGLLGRQLSRTFPNRSNITGRILEVSAWRATNGDSHTHKFPDYGVGVMSISSRYGKYLADITVGNGNSCVTLIAAEFELEGKIYRAQGPGNLCKFLQLDPSFDGYNLINGRELRVRGLAADEKLVRMRKKSNSPANCVGYYYIR